MISVFHIEAFINHKREGKEHSAEEIQHFINALVSGNVTDAQIGAWLMAVCVQGLNQNETIALSEAMVSSGDILNWSALDLALPLVDKHSSGGVGDKTTLIIAPILAACGIPMMKLSGRGLGHTGGTLDKLESIPGCQTVHSQEKIIQQVRDIGIYIGAASKHLAPADKILYEKRHETATVNQISLIASSIMSKKIAGGADCFVFDIKVGQGAFLKSLSEAKELAKTMKIIADHAYKKTKFIFSTMNEPLGTAVGNYLELKEVAMLLQGQPDDRNLYELSLELAAEMLSVSRDISLEEARDLSKQAILSGDAYQAFKNMLSAQGGTVDDLWADESEFTFDYYAMTSGYIKAINAENIGKAAKVLGAGSIDGKPIERLAGIVLDKKIGDKIFGAERICQLHYEITRAPYLDEARALLDAAIEIQAEPIQPENIIIDKM